jgi:glucuronokinase
MIIRTRAYARAGLIGNPSDGYFGKTISIICRNYAAEVCCYESPRVVIRPRGRDLLEFDSLDALAEDVRLNGYYGGIRLIKAAVKCFSDYCHEHGIDLDRRNFSIEYVTNIPVRVGLAGSSAIITATMRALMSFYGVQIGKQVLPNLVMSVEVDELGIGAGLQDRVIQTFEGVVFMDFEQQLMQEQGHGQYEQLDPALLPPLFVAHHDRLAEGTEVTHNDLRVRFDRGDQQVHDAIQQFATYAQEARDLIVAGRGKEIGPLLNANFDLRAKLCPISDGNRKLVEIGRNQGAAAKFAGSGGAVVATYDGDKDRLKAIRQAYAQVGAKVFVPCIEEGGVSSPDQKLARWWWGSA